jgi:hypothetical protein
MLQHATVALNEYHHLILLWITFANMKDLGLYDEMVSQPLFVRSKPGFEVLEGLLNMIDSTTTVIQPPPCSKGEYE